MPTDNHGRCIANAFKDFLLLGLHNFTAFFATPGRGGGGSASSRLAIRRIGGDNRGVFYQSCVRKIVSQGLRDGNNDLRGVCKYFVRSASSCAQSYAHPLGFGEPMSFTG